MKTHPNQDILIENDLDRIVTRKILGEIEIMSLRGLYRGIGGDIGTGILVDIRMVPRESDIGRVGKKIVNLVDDIVMTLPRPVSHLWMKICLKMLKENLINRNITLRGHGHVAIISR